MLQEHEIDKEIDCSAKNIQIETPNGWRKVLKMYRTIPLPVFKVELLNGMSIKASQHHLLRSNNEWRTVDELVCSGAEVDTKEGPSQINRISYIGEEQLYDMTIDDPEGAFYSNGIVSHNSTTFCARQMSLAHVIPGYRSIYVVPHHDHLNTYCNRYAQMEALWRAPLGTQLKQYKVYGKSVVEMIYCGEHSLAARGKTTDEVLIDEVQSMDPTLLEDILYTQTTSKIPTTIFAGTAMSTDTLLEAKWQDSSMGTWQVRAMDGKNWVDMYDSDTLFKVCSDPRGPVCPYTGKLLDISNGSYVHQNEKALIEGRIGLHVPQCIIPALCDDPVQWMKIYNKVKRTDSNKVLQECFGKAVETGAREITQKDLMRICTIEEDIDTLKERCRKGYYRFIVSGCDWGGSDYNAQTKVKTSYTVHCIIGLAPDDTVHILHYRRYSGMDYFTIAQQILNDHHEFRGQFLASDFGVGQLYNMLIRKAIPFDKHFIMTYVGPQAADLSETKNSALPNQLSLNKTEAISAVFQAVRSFTPPKLRCRKWEIMKEYLEDWLNMYRAPSESDQGSTKFRYIRAATKPDDALHAFTFAYVIMRVYMGEPLIQDPQLEQRVKQLMNGFEAPVQPASLNPDDFIIWG